VFSIKLLPKFKGAIKLMKQSLSELRAFSTEKIKQRMEQIKANEFIPNDLLTTFVQNICIPFLIYEKSPTFCK
jgi:hypothetical protein